MVRQVYRCRWEEDALAPPTCRQSPPIGQSAARTCCPISGPSSPPAGSPLHKNHRCPPRIRAGRARSLGTARSCGAFAQVTLIERGREGRRGGRQRGTSVIFVHGEGVVAKVDLWQSVVRIGKSCLGKRFHERRRTTETRRRIANPSPRPKFFATANLRAAVAEPVRARTSPPLCRARTPDRRSREREIRVCCCYES